MNLRKKNSNENKKRKPIIEVYLDWYKSRKETRVNNVRIFLLVTVVLLHCIFVSNCMVHHYIADGAYKYDDDVYKQIEVAIQESIPSETGMGPDMLGLKEKLKCIEKRYQNENEIFFNYVVLDTKYNSERDRTIIICGINDGFFKPRVTTELESDYSFVQWERNFKSVQGYQNYFWKYYRMLTFVGGIIYFIILVILYNLAVWLIAMMLRKIVEHRSKKAEKYATDLTDDPKNMDPIPNLTDFADTDTDTDDYTNILTDATEED